MKGYTSRERFDESRRFVAVQEEMGRARLDADANEQAAITATDGRRRSADVADGSPDDGFRVGATLLLDAITSTAGWTGSGLAPGDLRVIPPSITLARREAESLPHVLRSHGHVEVRRVLPHPVDLRAVPRTPPPGGALPGVPGAAWQVAELHVDLRLRRPTTDEEVALGRVVVRDVDGAWHEVLDVPADHRAGVLRVPAAALHAVLDRGTGAATRAVLTGWGVRGLPPRADSDLDALVATDAALGGDVVLRGGGGTAATAGRLYVDGVRAFLEGDWRYTEQPFLPAPQPLSVPGAGQRVSDALEIDVWEREVHAWQDPFLAEPALDGDPTTFRRQQVVQVRARRDVDPGAPPPPATPLGGGRLSSDVPDGLLPDRTAAPEPDRCRDRCLSTEQATTGVGYTGSVNAHVRVEVLALPGTEDRAVLVSRDNAALVAPLLVDLPPDGVTLVVGAFQAARFRAGDVVTLEDEAARLDPGDPRHLPVLRRVRSVDTATGRLELEPDGYVLPSDPAPLPAGGGPGRALRVADVAAVRRWDLADRLVTGVRYRLVDNLTFALDGADFRPGEHWHFTARVVAPDGAAQGVVERRTDVPPDGPWHSRASLGVVTSERVGGDDPVQRTFTDLRTRFLPLQDVRDRLAELDARHLAPGAFTVVVGDGERTFGHIDQDLAEGVTGDEAVHAALAELAGRPGTIYLRAGTYVLEHPVVLQGLSGVRILGDGAGTRLEVRGAGGAFVVDGCGADAPVALELMDLVEVPEADVPIGPEVGGALVGDLVPLDDGGGALVRADVLRPGGGLAGLLDALGAGLRALQPGRRRAFASLVATVLELRRLQRTQPGRPVEDVAPDQLATLRSLPHGVVSVGDSHGVLLRDLRLTSTERTPGAAGLPTDAGAGVLLTGTLEDVEVSGCAVRAGAGVVAAPLAPWLVPAAFVARPRAGLFVRGLRVTGNDLRARDAGAGSGVVVGEGELEGVVVSDNRVAGFATGVVVRDAAVVRHAEATARTSISDNRLVDVTLGIDVVADVVDVDRCVVRLAPVAAPLHVGVRVQGSGVRVSGCVVDLPATAPGASPLALEAGVVVGSGADADGTLDRPVTEVSVLDTRVVGVGAATLAHGVVVGGGGPVLDVTIARCDVRRLGGTGVRAFGHASSVGRLRVLDCTVDDVATAPFAWSGAVTAAATALVPAAAGAAPRTLLESLVAAGGPGVRPALDGVLRWTEAATLRAGIALSLVDGAVVARNRVRGVGTGDLPTQVPGADVHVAGIAVVGGEDARVDDNDVEDVHGAVRTVVPTVPPVVTVRPGVRGFLDALPSRAVRPAGDLHTALVGLRSLVLDYAVARRTAREQVGRRIYTAMEAVGTELATRGGQAARLAQQLTEAVEGMREAQGDTDHTAAAHLVRVAVSRAAELTAPDEPTGVAWASAARVDSAAAARSDAATPAERDALTAAAQDVVDGAAELLAGLDLGIDLAADGRAVLAAPAGSPAQETATLALARDLGTVAAARRLVAQVGGPVTASRARVLSGVLAGVEAQLAAPTGGAVTPAVVDALADGVDTLVDVLAPAHAPLAASVRQRYERLRRTRVRPAPADVTALRDALVQVRALRDAPGPATVGAAEAAAAGEQAAGELVMLTAGWVDRQLAAVAELDESGETRSLRLLAGDVRQLARLVGDDPALAPHVESLRAAVKAAADEPRDRARHKQDAARALATLRAEQAHVVGADAPPAPTTAPSQAAERLAGVAQLVLSLPDDVEERAAAVDALGTHLRVTIGDDALDLPSGERGELLERTSAAVAGLGAARAAARDAALHDVADVLSHVGARVAEHVGSPTAEAVGTLVAALPVLLDPDRPEPERVAATRAVLTARAATLSPSSAQALTSAATLADLRDRLDLDLSGVTLVPRPLPVPTVPAAVVEPSPADGVVAAQVAGTVAVLANRVTSGRRGVVVAGPGAHPLAPTVPEQDDPLEVDVRGNTVRGAVLAGLVVDPGRPARVRVADNDVAGCAGAVTDPASAPATGRAVVDVAGSGELTVSDNRLDGNGSSAHPGVVHAVVLHFAGDVTVSGNRVRHTGGQPGGGGLVVVPVPVPAGPVDGRSWDLTALTTRPFLDVDAPPRPPRVRPPRTVRPLDPGLLDVVGHVRPVALVPGAVSLAGVAGGSVPPSVGAATFAAVRPPALSVLTVAAAAPVAPVAAEQLAARWLAPVAPAAGSLRAAPGLRPLLDFLRRPPRVLVPRPPRPVRLTVRVCDNDVLTAGPALLVLGSAQVLLGATVTGNTLLSTGVSGAAYLRDVDSCVVGTNRLEGAAVVTVLVVRALHSLVAVSGNVLAGREPPASTTVLPTPPVLLPPVTTRPPVRLDLDLSDDLGGSVSVVLDPARVLAALRSQQDRAATQAAAGAQADFDVFARTNAIVTDPRAALVLETASRSNLLDVDLSTVIVRADLERLTGTRVTLPPLGGLAGGTGRRPLVRGAAGTLGRADGQADGPDDAPSDGQGDGPGRRAGRAATPRAAAAAAAGQGGGQDAEQGGDDLAVTLSRLTDDFGRILSDAALSPAAKLFGVARSGGLPDTAARAMVAEQLVRSGGDGDAALRAGLGTLTGVAPPATAPAPVRSQLPLLEQLLGSVLADSALDVRPAATVRPGLDLGGAVAPGPFVPIGPAGTVGWPVRVPPGLLDPVRPVPPPAAHTLVVIGGAQVALSGNATTAGADVRPAEPAP